MATFALNLATNLPISYAFSPINGPGNYVPLVDVHTGQEIMRGKKKS